MSSHHRKRKSSRRKKWTTWLVFLRPGLIKIRILDSWSGHVSDWSKTLYLTVSGEWRRCSEFMEVRNKLSGTQLFGSLPPVQEGRLFWSEMRKRAVSDLTSRQHPPSC